ncbi:unnamed protein product [Ceratitis capitata]|uniref:(Mediterranean fruit fly) hypothetical protein n=1 Tax=Ceratitis capitata TaxID=7213 RepID=A0A811UCG6_CERCA|nr:unnamed protein product [Ceratitis capitata]
MRNSHVRTGISTCIQAPTCQRRVRNNSVTQFICQFYEYKVSGVYVNTSIHMYMYGYECVTSRTASLHKHAPTLTHAHKHKCEGQKLYLASYTHTLTQHIRVFHCHTRINIMRQTFRVTLFICFSF